MKKATAFLKDDSGATAIEYVLIASAMGISLAAASPLLGSALQDKLSSLTTHITMGK